MNAKLRRRKENWIAASFLTPYLIVFLMFRMGPSLAGFFVSLTDWNVIGDVKFVGLKNFSRLLASEHFYTSLTNTGMFVLICVPLLVVLSLLMAVLFNNPLRGIGFARAVTIVPYVLIPAVVGVIWNWIFAYNFGILNYYLQKLGFESLGWLINSKYALPSVSVVIIWSYMGYNTILYLAGLQGIPESLREAARIDGANNFQCFTRITIPLLKPVTSLVVTLTIINVVQIFDQIYVMTNGGPGTATLTLVQYLYSSAFKDYKMGYASAVGTVIVIILIALMLINNLVTRERD
jgi:multiple sugar transport system permease protein